MLRSFFDVKVIGVWGVAILVSCSNLAGQDLPRIAVPTFGPEIRNRVPDAGFARNQMASKDDRSSKNLVGQLESTGKTIYQVIHDGMPVVITVHDGGAIDVLVKWTVTESNFEEFQKLHPKASNLLEVLREDHDSTKVVSLEIKAEYAAMHEGQLRTLYPMIYRIFKQYTD